MRTQARKQVHTFALALGALVTLSGWVVTGAGGAASMAETVAAAEAAAARGRILYKLNCHLCHGDHAQGDGSAAEVLSVPPADLTRISVNNGEVFPREQVEGAIDGCNSGVSREMPRWGDVFRAIEGPNAPVEMIHQKLSDLVAYVESVQNPRQTADGQQEE